MIVNYKDTPCLVLEKHKGVNHNSFVYCVLFKNEKIYLRSGRSSNNLIRDYCPEIKFVHQISREIGSCVIYENWKTFYKKQRLVTKTKKLLHREDGPAIEYVDNTENEYWLNDKYYVSRKTYEIALKRFIRRVENGDF